MKFQPVQLPRHRINDRRTVERRLLAPHLLLLCFLLLALGARTVHANAVASMADMASPVASDGIVREAGDDRIPRYQASSIIAAPLRSSARTRLASLEAPPLVPASTRPRRTTSEIKAKTAAGERRASNSSSSEPGELPRISRAVVPVVPVDGPGPGQTGYVHFFLLETPEGEEEIQLGIELADGRIAWSFPEVGAGIMPFVRTGSIDVSGRVYGIEHLYGLRPFPDEASMTLLREALWNRIAALVEGKTPYCNPFLRSEALCLSCLGFVQEALFPGRMAGRPAMPQDFPRTRSRLYYTTDDLLLYLTGFHEIATAEARARRIEELKLPSYLREELWQLVEATDVKDGPGAIDTSRMKNGADKPPVRGRSYTRTPPQRKRL